MKKKYLVSGLWVLAYIGTVALLYFINPLFVVFFVGAERVFSEVYRYQRIQRENRLRSLLRHTQETTRSIIYMILRYSRFTDDKGKYIKGRPTMLQCFIDSFWGLNSEADKLLNQK